MSAARPARASSTVGLDGEEAARRLLRLAGLDRVRVEPEPRGEGDHYDPRRRAIRLTDRSRTGRTLASLAIASHEVGHASQHAEGSALWNVRSALVPARWLGSRAAWLGMALGVVGRSPALGVAGVVALGLVAASRLARMTLERDANRRAGLLLAASGLVTVEEREWIEMYLERQTRSYRLIRDKSC